MKLVIDIPEGLKIDFESEQWIALSCMEMKDALMNGTPLTERPKGKWIKVITHKSDFGETWHFKCSICGEKSNKGYRPLENYCHNCGAEMSGGGEK